MLAKTPRQELIGDLGIVFDDDQELEKFFSISNLDTIKNLLYKFHDVCKNCGRMTAEDLCEQCDGDHFNFNVDPVTQMALAVVNYRLSDRCNNPSSIEEFSSDLAIIKYDAIDCPSHIKAFSIRNIGEAFKYVKIGVCKKCGEFSVYCEEHGFSAKNMCSMCLQSGYQRTYFAAIEYVLNTQNKQLVKESIQRIKERIKDETKNQQESTKNSSDDKYIKLLDELNKKGIPIPYTKIGKFFDIGSHLPEGKEIKHGGQVWKLPDEYEFINSEKFKAMGVSEEFLNQAVSSKYAMLQPKDVELLNTPRFSMGATVSGWVCNICGKEDHKNKEENCEHSKFREEVNCLKDHPYTKEFDFSKIDYGTIHRMVKSYGKVECAIFKCKICNCAVCYEDTGLKDTCMSCFLGGFEKPPVLQGLAERLLAKLLINKREETFSFNGKSCVLVNIPITTVDLPNKNLDRYIISPLSIDKCCHCHNIFKINELSVISGWNVCNTCKPKFEKTRNGDTLCGGVANAKPFNGRGSIVRKGTVDDFWLGSNLDPDEV